MSEILAVKNGLPPGLWLPTPDESTDQYLTENFRVQNREFEDVVDYGAFVVALALWNQEETGRVSLMPRTADIEDLYDIGYGFTDSTFRKTHGTLGRLQRALGFFPNGYEPDKSELIDRFKWMASYAYPHAKCEKDETSTIYDIIEWGSVRHLSPSSEIVYTVMGGDTAELRGMFGLETAGALAQSTKMGLYTFGTEVINDHGRPLKRDELDDHYADRFEHLPSNVIRAHFGTYRDFWREFDYITDTHGFTKEDFMKVSLQWAIANQRTRVQGTELNRLSQERKFLSRLPMSKYFGGIPAFCDELDSRYQAFQAECKAYQEQGVDPEVFRIFCRRYENTPQFQQWLTSQKENMITLSSASDISGYTLRILESGFNLLDEEIFSMQLEDLHGCLNKLGITNKRQRALLLSAIPRFNVADLGSAFS